MSPSLSSALSNRFKQKLIPASVIDVIGGKCSVRLSGEGTKLTNLSYFGPIPVIGSQVVVDYRNASIPIVMTVEMTDPPSKDTTKNLSCSVPENLYIETNPSPWPGPIPPLPQPILPPTPPPSPPPIVPPPQGTNCNNQANGPYSASFNKKSIANDGYSPLSAFAGITCQIRHVGGFQSYATIPMTFSPNNQIVPYIKVYGVDGSRNRVSQGNVNLTNNGILVSFNPSTITDIRGLEITLEVDVNNVQNFVPNETILTGTMSAVYDGPPTNLGVELPIPVPGMYYYVEGAGGPWTKSAGNTGAWALENSLWVLEYDAGVSNDPAFNQFIRKTGPIGLFSGQGFSQFTLDVGTLGLAAQQVDAHYGRVFFQSYQPTVGVPGSPSNSRRYFVQVADGYNLDNAGSMGFIFGYAVPSLAGGSGVIGLSNIGNAQMYNVCPYGSV